MNDRPTRGVEGFEALAELALDLHWSWNHGTDRLWRRLDAELWERTQNPWAILQTVSDEELRAAFADADFATEVTERLRVQRTSTNAATWFRNSGGTRDLTTVAYFSMEFMLSEALPIYAGGLGNVAGDLLKAASDLGVPVIGVGLLYQQGYFRQVIDADGRQRALFPYNDPDQLPISPLRLANGEWLRFRMDVPGRRLWVRGWQAKIRRTTLFLLDTNDPANAPADRTVTGELYGGDPEQRLLQELVLGIGGWRLLTRVGLRPDVCHLNEGHAALVVLERARDAMRASKLPFAAALTATRIGNVFTTHTAVDAGFDRFTPALIEHYLGDFARHNLGIPTSSLLALGRENPENDDEPFNMAYLALRGAAAVNAVSELHARVSRGLFQTLFPRWPKVEVPVRYVTNGVHAPTWESAAVDAIWTGACGNDRWLQSTETLEQDVRQVPDEALWQMRGTDRRLLVNYARERSVHQLAATGARPSSDAIRHAAGVLEPETLTLGFARRFATYKRPNLLLHDPERLLDLLANTERPVQLIAAGKAHPADLAGQALVSEWVRFAQRPEAAGRIVFLADYDMLLTQHLVRGVDVWINTPRLPWEACGTSGMKVLVNGGLNLSELDGWWAEAYAPDVGWALGDGREHDDDRAWDAAEADALYDLLEHVVVPEFYRRDARGIPVAWMTRMRESMARLTARFSANRAVREYTERFYRPAATGVRARMAESGAVARSVTDWQESLAKAWNDVRFVRVSAQMAGPDHAFDVVVFLGSIAPDAVRAEIYADGVDSAPPLRQPLDLQAADPALSGAWLFRGKVPAARPLTDYTPRVVPWHPSATVPLEAHYILWAH